MSEKERIVLRGCDVRIFHLHYVPVFERHDDEPPQRVMSPVSDEENDDEFGNDSDEFGNDSEETSDVVF